MILITDLLKFPFDVLRLASDFAKESKIRSTSTYD